MYWPFVVLPLQQANLRQYCAEIATDAAVGAHCMYNVKAPCYDSSPDWVMGTWVKALFKYMCYHYSVMLRRNFPSHTGIYIVYNIMYNIVYDI